MAFFSSLFMMTLPALVSGTTLRQNLAARNEFVPGYPADVNTTAKSNIENVSTPVSHPLADLNADSAI
jgi:hypothetical protein